MFSSHMYYFRYFGSTPILSTKHPDTSSKASEYFRESTPLHMEVRSIFRDEFRNPDYCTHGNIVGVWNDFLVESCQIRP